MLSNFVWYSSDPPTNISEPIQYRHFAWECVAHSCRATATRCSSTIVMLIVGGQMASVYAVRRFYTKHLISERHNNCRCVVNVVVASIRYPGSRTHGRYTCNVCVFRRMAWRRNKTPKRTAREKSCTFVPLPPCRAFIYRYDGNP